MQRLNRLDPNHSTVETLLSLQHKIATLRTTTKLSSRGWLPLWNALATIFQGRVCSVSVVSKKKKKRIASNNGNGTFEVQEHHFKYLGLFCTFACCARMEKWKLLKTESFHPGEYIFTLLRIFHLKWWVVLEGIAGSFGILCFKFTYSENKFK